MNKQNQKGITGIDISISIVIIVLFTSLMTNMFFNVNILKKEAQRKTEATYLAISVIEALKQIPYNELPTGYGEANKEITLEEINEKIDTPIKLENGYNVNINIQNYQDIKQDGELQDLIKKVNVLVSYKSSEKIQNVELNTVIIDGG